MAVLIPCVNPQIVYDCNGKKHVVPCGSCEVCRTLKRSESLSKLNEETRSRKHTFFVTLTYSDANIPKLYFREYLPLSYSEKSVLSYSVPRGYDFKRSFGFAKFLLDGNFSEVAESQALRFNHRVPYDCLAPVFERLDSVRAPFVPVLNPRDLQLFLKRLRKKIHVFCLTNGLNRDEERLRYYAVGEYGPAHFRPHYHLLLFTDSDAVSEQLIRFVSSCWALGYTNTSRARDGATSYVAGYLNSFVYLPRFYTDYCKFWRPFARSSAGLGAPCFGDAEESDLFAIGRFDDYVIQCGSEYVTNCFRRSYFSRLFAPLSQFFAKDYGQSYGIFKRMSEIYRKYGWTPDCRQVPERTLKTAFSLYIDEDMKVHRIGSEWYVLLDVSRFPVDSFAGYMSWQFSDSACYVKKDTFLSRCCSLARRVDKLLKLFGKSLYDFRLLSLSWFSSFVLRIRDYVRRLGIGSLVPYYKNMEVVEQECKLLGYLPDQVEAALDRFLVVRPDGDDPGYYRKDSDGFFVKTFYLPDYFRYALEVLRAEIRERTKHRHLNDLLLFNSNYMNQYGRFVFS